MPEVDGITTDEDCIVAGSRVMQAWHELRFAQRHQLMSSMGLGRRLLAMTGRMSIYRGSVALDPGFVQAIEDDHLDHWRLGRVKLLTGEDKSTWFWLLRQGRAMLYLPDVRVVTIEHPPARRLLPAATQLMLRWFGNMLRSSSRAIALGPRQGRRLHLVVPDRPAPVDVDAADRPDRGAAVRARQEPRVPLHLPALGRDHPARAGLAAD